MKKSSITLAAALAALASNALAAEPAPTGSKQWDPNDVGNQQQTQSMQRQQKQERLHTPANQGQQQRSQKMEQKAKQIEMNQERAIKKRIGPGPVA